MIDRYGTPSRPDDIPEAVWHSCWWAQAHGLQEAASRQIMAAKAEERERCAIVAESLHLECTDNHGDLYDGDVAAAIRKRGEAD